MVEAKMRKFNVVIKGLEPGLLVNRCPDTEEDAIPKRVAGESNLSPEEEAERRLYKDEEGKYCFPALNIQQALARVASDFAIKGRGRKTYKSLISYGVLIEPHLIPINPQKYVIDKRKVIIPRTGGRVDRYRPLFKNWSLRFNIILLEEQIPSEILREVLRFAGVQNGLGDYRPQRGGPFGRFEVLRFEEVTEK